MNHNGILAIILIYLMTAPQPLFMDGKKCQLLVYGSSASGSRANLYSRFKDRLNATSNFAKSEYDLRTSEVLDSIYNFAGNILSEQLKEERTEADSQNTNYADKLLDGADTLGSRTVPSAAVASTATSTTNIASYVADKIPDLINAPVVVSNAKSDCSRQRRRQAHKIETANRIYLRSPYPGRPKDPWPETKIDWRQSSRPMLPSFSAPMNAERVNLSSISTESQEKQYATLEEQKMARNIVDSSLLGWTGSRSLDAGSGHKMNGLAADGEGSGYGGDDDSSNRFASPSVKWPRKLQIDGRKNNLRDCRSSPAILFGADQSNRIIDLGEDVYCKEKMCHRQESGGVAHIREYGPHIKTRNADSFPEVFSRPLVESSSPPIIGDGNGLNEVIKNANSLLTSVQGVASSSYNPMKIDDSSHRIGKQIQRFDEVPGNGQNTEAANSAISLASTANLTNVMEKVLGELESLKECKAADDAQPEGSPCDVPGTWNSEVIGLQFHMSIANPSPSSRTYAEGKIIEIELTERVPPRRHDLMDCDWFLTGSVVKQVGGPFYMTAQKADRFIVATFAGLCKTCGGIPTIFGSWTFVYPAHDCQDISLAIETKHDVLRKDTLETKRKHRRERLNSKDKGKCSKA